MFRVMHHVTRSDIMGNAWTVFRNVRRTNETFKFAEALRQSWLEHRVIARRLHAERSDKAEAINAVERRLALLNGNDARLGLPRPRLDIWNKYHVEDLSEEWGHRPDVQARFDQILALERQWDQVWRDVADASGWTKAGNEEEELWQVADAITARAREIEPQTVEGVAIKARFIAFEAWHLLFQEPEPDMDWEPSVARAFVASMMRLGGRDFLMRPWEGRTDT